MASRTTLLSLYIALSSSPISAGTFEEEVPELPAHTVTGSHLDLRNQAIPHTSIDSSELMLWGDPSPAQTIRDLPYSFGYANNENESNSGSGSAGANIHGMGNLSTLTLINGRRAGGNSPLGFQHGGFADLNLIPGVAIDEIQVMADGTSVAYGSDAVAGTVNILLHDAWTGNRIDTLYSDTTDGDASEKQVAFITGQDVSEATHLVLAGSWYQRNAIYARDRKVSENTDRRAQGGQNQGSPTFPGRINYAGTEYILRDGVSAPDNLSDYRLFDGSEDLYNFSSSAPAIPEVERKSVMAHLTHQIQPAFEVWSELLFTRSQFNNGLAPAPWSGSAFSPGILNAARNSPHRPADMDPDDLSQLNYRSFELGNLEFEQEKDAFRGLLGLRGSLNEWNWETALLYIRTDQEDRYSGIAGSNAVIGAINDGSFNPFANAFATDVGYDNAAALQAAERHPVNEFNEEFWSYDLKLEGSLFELDAGSIDVATGLEFRSEEIQVGMDDLFENGNNLGGAQAASFEAEREVAALYLETNIPLIQRGSHSLDLRLSGRYETYQDESTSSDAQDNQYDALVYKGALFYEPSDDLSVYLSYGTSFRAPTLTESYGGDQLASYIYDDPTGQTPAATRVFTFISGNPDLKPETSESMHFGFAYHPHPDQGWKVKLNYYRIRTEDSIVNSGQDVVNRDDGGALRDGDGNLFLVFANWFNAAEIETDGLDLLVSYTHPTTTGSLTAELGVNHVFNYDIQTTSDSPSVSYLGRLVDPRASNENIAGPGSIPEYKGYARFTWAHQQLTVAATVNYIHSLDDNPSFTTNNTDRKIDAWTSLDLAAQYAWDSEAHWLFQNTTLTVNVENVTDEDPPFAAGAFADGYDASLYSLEGRRLMVSLNRRF